jgi:cyclopropane-fatty-acyl-phospholipid synthase
MSDHPDVDYHRRTLSGSQESPAESQPGGASARAIRHHYDVGNEFYRLWLDSSLTYSGAMWRDALDLESAQLAKLDYHVEQARAAGAPRVLDVGCGWGSLLTRLTATHGVSHAVGLTLSQEQAHWIEALGQKGVEVRVESWADHQPAAPYRAIISIGALEHFARIDVPVAEKIQNYRHFFECCHRWLEPGGYMSLQAIGYGNLLRDDIRGGFVAQEIFPESDFVRLSEIIEGSEFLFEVVSMRNDPEDYERTCSEWLHRLRKNREEAVRIAGADLVDKWERYLDLSVRGWQIRATNLLRLTMRRIDHPRVRPRAR